MSVSDIIVTPCRILYSDPGTTLPADTVAAGGNWPAGWTQLGYTNTPLSIELKREKTKFDIQESLGAVGSAVKSEELNIETTLAELNLAELALAWGGTFSQTPAGAGQPAKDELIGGDDHRSTVKQWGFEGDYVSAAGNTHPVRLFIWRGESEFGGKLEFGKTDPTGNTLRIEAQEDMTKTRGQRMFKFVKITAPAAS